MYPIRLALNDGGKKLQGRKLEVKTHMETGLLKGEVSIKQAECGGPREEIEILQIMLSHEGGEEDEESEGWEG